MGEGGRWDDLYRRFEAVTREREAGARSREEAERALRELEAWCARATDRVMEDIAAAAKLRAGEFERHTRRKLEVEYPSHPPIGLGDEGPYMTFMRLSLEGSHVHLYSYRGPGALPAIHLVHTNEDRLPRHRRLVSQPGCFVARRSDDGYELRSARSDGTEAAVTSIDDLVFKAVEVLVLTVGKRPEAEAG